MLAHLLECGYGWQYCPEEAGGKFPLHVHVECNTEFVMSVILPRRGDPFIEGFAWSGSDRGGIWAGFFSRGGLDGSK